MYESLTFKTVKIIDKVPQESWDAMVSDNPYMTWGWHKTVEETCIVKQDVYYIMAICNDQLCGGAVCTVIKPSRQMRDLDNIVFGRLKRFFNFFHISMVPLLDCSPAKGRGTHFLVKDNLSSTAKDEVIAALLKKVETLAVSKNLAIAFSDIKKDQINLKNILSDHGYYHTLGYPINILDIEWSTFDDYIRDTKSLSKNVRKNIRLQINRNLKAGVVISDIDHPEKYGNRLHQLVSINNETHNKLPFIFNPKFFEKLKKNLGDNVSILTAEKNNITIGVKIILKRNGFANSCFIGVDHEAAGNDFTYFNLAFYSTITNAIKTDIKRIDYGNAMYSIKTDRGCYILPTYLYYKPANFMQKIVIPLWFRFQSFWYERKLPDHIRLHMRK